MSDICQRYADRLNEKIKNFECPVSFIQVEVEDVPKDHHLRTLMNDGKEYVVIKGYYMKDDLEYYDFTAATDETLALPSFLDDFAEDVAEGFYKDWKRKNII